MRHRKNSKRLSRQSAHRRAVLKNVVKSLLVKEKINTNLALAKEARKLAERLITLGRQDTLSARRQAFKILTDHALVKLLFGEIGPRFAKRNGGYTRIVHFGNRRGDNARLAILELVEQKEKKEEKKGKKEVKDRKEPKKEVKSALKQKEPKEIEEAEVLEEKKEEKTADAIKKPEHAASGKEEKQAQKKKDEQKGFLGGLRKFLKKPKD
ncbi:MAG: 50S ribosomal protein L17 [Candidatus Omnitrophica bacterium]|nr:50S ribosomal protein L17 [Candidatus Omnitrophota bacterium]MBU1924833.1 50S ribosomal protein L17 [Candidatus Omnitrophota bacterium]